MNDLIFSPTDFVAVLNQTLEMAYPNVVVVGELANLRVSKNRWVYFTLKDEHASVKFFGTVYQLPGPLEDGMMLQVRGNPRLHSLYGFSVNVQSIQPVGEGSLKRAATLLEAKLKSEGLFDAERKRLLPFPPAKIGLITSKESAAYNDFIKILNTRWGGIEVLLVDTQVQGESAPAQLISALEYLNTHEDLDLIVMTRGGGSPDDLAAFSTEQVTRAVAASRVPTLVAIGHEVDVSLVELAADQRASTPSNAAELLTPDKNQVLGQLPASQKQLAQALTQTVSRHKQAAQDKRYDLRRMVRDLLSDEQQNIQQKTKLLGLLDPAQVLKRGYAIIRAGGLLVGTVSKIRVGQNVSVQLRDGQFEAQINHIDKVK
ncbi:MAG: exodeoxyribonuclease VII large subunit [Candidatus Saccharibacteria bacterium]|nr:exodeoxyribonuclease VII large subunit [Candidatus Saccharibacteria bacterium]